MLFMIVVEIVTRSVFRQFALYWRIVKNIFS